MFHYRLLERDPEFDLLTGTLPDALHLYFGNQLARARALIAHRTPMQIDYLLDSLDWIFQDSGAIEPAYATAKAYQEGERLTSRVNALKLRSPNFDLSNQSSILDATWSDYFAVLAIAYADEALYEYKAQPQAPTPEWTIGFLQHMTACAIESMDAICYAELLIALDNNVSTRMRKEFQERGRKGGLRKTARFSELRDKVLRYSDKYLNKSVRETARLSYETFQSEVNTVLHTTDPEKQLEKWIGSHRRQQRNTEQTLLPE